jgi:hypothetical protein
MKRAIVAILPGAVAIAFMAAVSAQEKPNFAGTWKASGSFNVWTITVEGSKMTVTMTVAGNSESTVYMLDGTPSIRTIDGPNGPVENVLTSTWEGNVLVTTITAPGTSRVERRSIEADGTMTVQTTFTMMQGKPAPPPPPGAGVMVLKKIGSSPSPDTAKPRTQ